MAVVETPMQSTSPIDPPEATTESKPSKTKPAEQVVAIEPHNEASSEEGNVKSSSEKKEGESSERGGSKDTMKSEGKRKSSSEKKEEESGERRGSKDTAKRKSTKKSIKGRAGGKDLDNDEDEEKEEEQKIIYPIDEKIQQTLRTAWTLLVKKNQKKKTEISEADVPTVMRSTGINPTEAQIHTLIAYAKSQDLPTCSKGFLTYENFEQRVAETLQLHPELWIRKKKDQILAALHTICEYKDQIEAEKFKKIMMTEGDVMNDPEGNLMLRLAKNRDTSMLYLDEYADILSKDAIPQPPPDPTVW